MTTLTRRQFLHSAGGVTFLLLAPVGRGLFAVPDSAGGSLPHFTALPYLQPGTSCRLVEGEESVVIAWQTEGQPADFALDYGPTRQYGKTVAPARTERRHEDGAARFGYAATLAGLPLSRRCFYRLHGGGRTVAEGFFTTRKKRGERTVDPTLPRLRRLRPPIMAPSGWSPASSPWTAPSTASRPHTPTASSTSPPARAARSCTTRILTKTPAKWLHSEDDNTAYNARFHSSAHSLTVFHVDGSTLTMTQVDETGQEIDRITVTKAPTA